MIGLAIALIVIGLVFGFVIPWVGIVVGIVGLALFLAFVAGFGRRAGEPGRRRRLSAPFSGRVGSAHATVCAADQDRVQARQRLRKRPAPVLDSRPAWPVFPC